MADTGGFREKAVDLWPWKKDGYGAKLVWVLGLGQDALVEKMTQGTHAHFVGDAQNDALDQIGQDRGVFRGLTEGEASYRDRLGTALDDGQRRGNAWAVLRQALGYLLAATPGGRVVQTNYSVLGVPIQSNWQSYGSGDDTSVSPLLTQEIGALNANWNWDQTSKTNGSWGRWRWYLVLENVAPQEWCTRSVKWGASGEKWGSGRAWGIEENKDRGVRLKIILRDWGPAAPADWVIVTFDASLFSVAGAAGVDNPGGTYGRWSKVVSRHHVRARSTEARYFRGK